MEDNGNGLRMYIVINLDAKMGKGKAAAQVGIYHYIQNIREMECRR